MKKAGFFDPYLDTLGGGERYTLTLAEHLSHHGWSVDVFWDDQGIREKVETRFNLDLKDVKFLPQRQDFFKKGRLGADYDFFFWLSDGSIPWLSSRCNFLHFQVPFHGVGGRSLWNRIKLKKIHHIVCNSYFTKKFIDREYRVNAQVIYPPVDIESFSPGQKKNHILAVGRFSQLLQAKSQDLLITSFKKLYDQGLKDWQLILAGATDIGGQEFFQKLKKQAQGYPIKILADIDFKTLKNLYAEAKIFWSASGFSIDEEKFPEKVEHFGITIVEAMAAGCVPLLVAKGGAKEIIKEGKIGFLWEQETELIKLTRVLTDNPQNFQTLSKAVIKLSRTFSKKRFCEEFDEIITAS